MGTVAASGLTMALFMAAFAVLGSTRAQESFTVFPAIFLFGDSTVDVGNNNYRKAAFKANYLPYGRDFTNHRPTGRFCNGKLSREASGKKLLSGANFASAGAAYDEKANTFFVRTIFSSPLGCFPALLSFFKYSQKGCIPRVTKDVQGFNAKLNITAMSLQKQLPGLRLVVLDVFTPLYDVIQSPSNYGRPLL